MPLHQWISGLWISAGYSRMGVSETQVSGAAAGWYPLMIGGNEWQGLSVSDIRISGK